MTKNKITKTNITQTKIALVVKNNSTEITLIDYEKLLSEIKKQIDQAQSDVIKIITRQKVAMAWNIGKIINQHLSRNKKTGYGEKLITQLALDTALADKVLYKMRSFYQTYPTLPKDDDRLNWTHYQMLSGVKKDEERKRLENLAKENSWTTDDLQKEVTKTKNGKGKFAKKKVDESDNKKPANKKLYPIRGKLFSYPLIKLENADTICIDCGFNFFREVENPSSKIAKTADKVDVTKKSETYSLKKSDIHPRKFNTYKAYLDRVVDGDTIRVTVDLGFKTFHNEIIRLKGIDAPEIKTNAGEKSARALSNILKNIPFLIIKTIKIDIYGRYVADVFFAEKEKLKTEMVTETDPQKVADEGIYLNQILLDRGLARALEE
jgi:endonuclease YncB( thermonuclease family)